MGVIDMDRRLREALKLHQRGDFSGAISLYRDVLADNHNDPVATHFLGLLRFQSGNHAEGLSLLQHSLKLSPGELEFILNAATALIQSGDPTRAIGLIEKIGDRQFNSYRAQLVLASGLVAANRTTEAISAFDRALALNPASIEALLGKATTFFQDAQFAEALAVLDSPLLANEQHASAAKLRGSILLALKDHAAAAREFEVFCRSHPENSDAWECLGVCLQNDKQFIAALAAHDEAIALDNVSTNVLTNRSTCLRLVGRTGEAVDVAEMAISLSGRTFDTHLSYGLALQADGKFKKAADQFSQALAICPSSSVAERNAAIANLQSLNFIDGWRHYEGRAKWNADTAIADSINAESEYGTEKLIEQLPTDQVVFIKGEQGIGDEIMFGSLLFDALKTHKQLVVEVDSRLVSIFNRSIPRIQFCKHGSAASYPHNTVRLGSLAFSFRRALKDFQNYAPQYLLPEPSIVEQLKNQYLKTNKHIVGLSWKTLNPNDHGRRTVKLADLCRLLARQNVSVLNLQYGTTREESTFLKNQLGESFIDISTINLTEDLEMVCALTYCCDTVVTIGNSIAHLAGALGRPTFVLAPLSPPWKWIEHNGRSLWYQSVTIFRQNKSGVWNQPLNQLAATLTTKVSEVAAPVNVDQTTYHADSVINHQLALIQHNIENGLRELAGERIDRLLQAHPKDPVVLRAKAVELLSNHHFRSGVEHLIRASNSEITNSDGAIWGGEDFQGTLFVLTEPHLGECILLSCLFKQLCTYSQKIIIQVDGRLLKIFRRSFPSLTFIATGHNLKRLSLEYPRPIKMARMLDLMRYFVNSDSFSNSSSWLLPDPIKIADIRERYRRLFPGKHLIGISWRSAPKTDDVDAKNIDLLTLQRILHFETCKFVDIQYGDTTADRTQLIRLGIDAPWRDPTIYNFSDIDTAAAQLAALDKVISVSNSVAHLSAACGVETLVVLPKHAPVLWHWGSRGNKTPWYQSVEILRSGSDRGWEGIDNQIASKIPI